MLRFGSREFTVEGVLDFGEQAEPFDEGPVAVMDGAALGEEPAVCAVSGPADAIVDFHRLAR